VTLRIEPVGTDRAALRLFIGLPVQLYANEPGFEAPLRMDRDLLLHPRHAGIFQRGKAAYWLAWRDGRAVGRISAQVDPAVPAGLPSGVGLFGALDAVDDATVVLALTKTAEAWLRANGRSHAFGPCLLDINTEPGLLVEGHLEPVVTLTAWHPPYLRAHLEAAGYSRWHDLHCWKVRPVEIDPRNFGLRPRSGGRMEDIVLRHPTLRSLGADTKIICDLYNAAWADNWGFVPLVRSEITSMMRRLWLFQPADSVKIVELRGTPVAMLMTIPNLFELTKGLGTDPSLLGWLRLGLRTLRFRPRSGRIILFGIRPELRNSVVGAGILLRLFEDMALQKAKWKADWIEAGWVLEDNFALTKVLERFGFHRNKTLRLYGKPLGPLTEGVREE